MGDVTDELAARREASRRRNGEFGVFAHSSPELGLAPPAIPQHLADLNARVDRARERYTEALLDHIDAAMPRGALFVNYEIDSPAAHLRVRAGYDEDGEEMPREDFAAIDAELSELGEPYKDFDGDLVLDQEDEYGWDRINRWDLARKNAAEVAAYTARADWQESLDAQQNAAVHGIRESFTHDVEALDVAPDLTDGRLYVAGVIRRDGRADASLGAGENVSAIDNLAALLPDPARAGLQRNELTGHWRLTCA
jgi:hypothetical protein